MRKKYWSMMKVVGWKILWYNFFNKLECEDETRNNTEIRVFVDCFKLI